MKIIKFRGETAVGKILFGDFKNFNKEIYMFDAYEDVWREVKKVAQFVGYDANGEEIYEGDKLKHVDDENYNAIAHFETFIGVKTGTIQNLYDCHSEKIFHAQNSKFWRLKE